MNLTIKIKLGDWEEFCYCTPMCSALGTSTPPEMYLEKFCLPANDKCLLTLRCEEAIELMRERIKEH